MSMGLTTPSAPFDVAAVFPELAGQRRTTVRLHPRPGKPAITDSSMGGPLLWPADEAWPACPDPLSHDPSEGRDPLPLVPVMQLSARDVPELPFPDGTDTLQVLWCPLDHEPYFQPHAIVRWRKAEEIGSLLIKAPEPDPDSDDSHLPTACVLSPERVEEYPDGWELPPELRARIWAWEKDASNPDGWSYFSHLSAAPGSKVGGWVDWIQDPVQFECGRGHEMAHLLTIASWELDIESSKRWAPVEDRPLLTPHAPPEVQNPTDLMIQDAGSLYMFVCLECPERPVDSLSQGS
ncbi:DUF1963 domain-containing protein [Nonomuraea spiralis]|uniref:DUF1963 domain-containing protein n=1 Tax=Nonomuraea spiralis TaxID=46182 RepID=UPI00379C15F6